MVQENTNLNEQFRKLQEMQQLEAAKKEILTKILTKEAFERLARVKSVNPQLATQAEFYLLQIYQTGKLGNLITDDKLKELLKTLSEKKEMNIKRK